MSIPKHVKAANVVLRSLDAIIPGENPTHGKFQLKWSQDLISFVPEYVWDGSQGAMVEVLDHYCGCGVNKIVHEPACTTITVSKTRFRRVSTFGPEGQFPSYINVWALCLWVAPPNRFEWRESFGTDDDYPKNGRYVPVHRGSMCVVVPRNATPLEYVPAAQVMVRMFTEHAQNWKKWIDEERDKARLLQMPIYDSAGKLLRDADKGTKFWKIKDRIKEKMRHFNPTGTVGYTKSIEPATTIATGE